jgi:hypothetical protein
MARAKFGDRRCLRAHLSHVVANEGGPAVLPCVIIKLAWRDRAEPSEGAK